MKHLAKHSISFGGSGTGDNPIRESISRVKIFKDFQESQAICPATAWFYHQWKWWKVFIRDATGWMQTYPLLRYWLELFYNESTLEPKQIR